MQIAVRVPQPGCPVAVLTTLRLISVRGLEIMEQSEVDAREEQRGEEGFRSVSAEKELMLLNCGVGEDS